MEKTIKNHWLTTISIIVSVILGSLGIWVYFQGGIVDSALTKQNIEVLQKDVKEHITEYKVDKGVQDKLNTKVYGTMERIDQRLENLDKAVDKITK